MKVYNVNNNYNYFVTGLKWQRQLVFRSKLTMHTAYDRKDNTSPASVTCVTAAKGGRGVAVGDARGRVCDTLVGLYIKIYYFTCIFLYFIIDISMGCV